jgi:hypothetical protein
MPICPECEKERPRYNPKFPRCFDCNENKKAFIAKSTEYDTCPICNVEKKQKNFKCCGKCKFDILKPNDAFKRLQINNIQKIHNKDPLALPKNIMTMIYELVEEEPFEHTFRSDKWSEYLVFGIYKDNDIYKVSKLHSIENNETGQRGIDIRNPDRIVQKWLDEVFKYMDITWGSPSAVYRLKSKNNSKACIRKCRELMNEFTYQKNDLNRFTTFAENINFEGFDFIPYNKFCGYDSSCSNNDCYYYDFGVWNKFQLNGRKEFEQDNMQIKIFMNTDEESIMRFRTQEKMKYSLIVDKVKKLVDNAHTHFRQYYVGGYSMNWTYYKHADEYEVISPYENLKFKLVNRVYEEGHYDYGKNTTEIHVEIISNGDYQKWDKLARELLIGLREDLENLQ